MQRGFDRSVPCEVHWCSRTSSEQEGQRGRCCGWSTCSTDNEEFKSIYFLLIRNQRTQAETPRCVKSEETIEVWFGNFTQMWRAEETCFTR